MKLLEHPNQNSSNLELQTYDSMAHPFLKWAGGKTQLIQQIVDRLPIKSQSGRIRKYAEPFIGGGAVFFHMADKFDIDEFYISDINKELILAYRTIKQDVDTLIRLLDDIERSYSTLDPEEQRGYYYGTRKKFNDGISTMDYGTYNNSWTERTAQIIFLNRTCFNGLYRVNSHSEFNVSMGSYKNPTICNADNLKAVSRLLQRTKIYAGDFELCEQFVDADTLVYLDPPYRPISATSSFKSYSSYDFDEQAQVRLSSFFRRLDARGAKLMLSNSDPKNENPDDLYFDQMYMDYHIERVHANRMINCNPDKRGQITELLVTNY